MKFKTNDLSDTLLNSAFRFALSAGYAKIADNLSLLMKSSDGFSMDEGVLGGKSNLLGMQQVLAEDSSSDAQLAVRCLAHARIVIKSLNAG